MEAEEVASIWTFVDAAGEGERRSQCSKGRRGSKASRAVWRVEARTATRTRMRKGSGDGRWLSVAILGRQQGREGDEQRERESTGGGDGAGNEGRRGRSEAETGEVESRPLVAANRGGWRWRLWTREMEAREEDGEDLGDGHSASMEIHQILRSLSCLSPPAPLPLLSSRCHPSESRPQLPFVSVSFPHGRSGGGSGCATVAVEDADRELVSAARRGCGWCRGADVEHGRGRRWEAKSRAEAAAWTAESLGFDGEEPKGGGRSEMESEVGDGARGGDDEGTGGAVELGRSWRREVMVSGAVVEGGDG